MNYEIRVLIIEDDIKASNYLTSLIDEKFEEVDIIGYSNNVKDSKKKINELKPEIIFMDILLKDGNAFEILDNVVNDDFEVIFVTAYDQYLQKAIEHYAFQYILKPYEFLKLKEVIDQYKIRRNRMFSLAKYKIFKEFINERFSKLMLHVNNEHIMVNLNDVVKCQADGNYSIFSLLNGEQLLASKSLKYYDDLISHKGFFRAHRSILVNINHIKSIYKKEAIILNNAEKIRVSQRNKSNLSNLIKLLS